ncbi:MAG: UvrD-helicase domain-containing protein [Proteobacteria bacterium]|nr:UvrD-helicase domain-containing protein [Pseudomonadota bacterium]
MANLMLHRNIFRNFSKLPLKIQKRLSEFIDKFQKDPSDGSLHLHSLKESVIDPKVRGANLSDDYRAIVIAPEKGDTYLLMHIDKHDAAYQWAKNKRFEIHRKTGVFQVFDVAEVEEIADDRGEEVPAPIDDYPLQTFSAEELFQAGVPQALIPAVQAIDSDESLEALSDYLPPDCRDVLHGMAAGLSLDESLEEMLGSTASPVDVSGPGDFSRIGERVNFDLVLVKGEEHLRDILKTKTIEEWRVFLHPYQKNLVEWKTNGPMNITGSAGTGKTVALMHRAVHLARQLNETTTPSNMVGKVLVTTFTTNLSITLKHQLRNLAPDTADGIEVTNLHALSRTICRRSGWKGNIVSDLQDIWSDIWMEHSMDELPMPKDELMKEYEHVIDANGIENEDDYLTTVRSGRPKIGRKQRKAAWPIFRSMKRILKKRDLLTFEGAVHQARMAVEQGNSQKYRHVLVDEIQDFSLEALRLIRALSPVDEKISDPLCTAGDGHQRIYRSKIPLSRAGIEIRGRSRRLKINYRTSEQIRKFAQGILDGIEIDDLDGGPASVVGDHSIFKGPEPLIEHCRNELEESKIVVEWIRQLLGSANYKDHEICITPFKESVLGALSSEGIETFRLKSREVDPGEKEPGVRMGTMHRIKGLEFKAVAMLCTDPDDPLTNAENNSPKERCTRYVACTRAREQLLVTVLDTD